MDYLKLMGGLVLLVVSGDYLVKGGVGIATRLKISSLVIGMTVVAFGTSAPEFLVSLQAAIKGNPAIAIGNVVGSNIANIALILGMTAIVYPLWVGRNSIRYDWPAMMIASLLFTWASMNGEIGRLEGLSFVSILVAYTAWQIIQSRKMLSQQSEVNKEDTTEDMPIWKSIGFIAISCVGLAYGADFLIDGASNIAKSFGVSERIIGVTIVAFGTSLPELAASMVAAFKKETDIAIGNIVGSNIFNILSVIGMTALINPIPVEWGAFKEDYFWMLSISFILILLVIPFKFLFKTSKENKISLLLNGGTLGRLGGCTLLLLYITYIYLLLGQS